METRIRNRACALIVEENKILMVQHEKNGKHYWVLPGGGVEYGETLAEACIRELKEEANYTIQVEELLFVCDSVPPDNFRHVVNYFFSARHIDGDLVIADEAILADIQWIEADGLPHLTIFPHVTGEILEFIQTGSVQKKYLGNRWLA